MKKKQPTFFCTFSEKLSTSIYAKLTVTATLQPSAIQLLGTAQGNQPKHQWDQPVGDHAKSMVCVGQSTKHGDDLLLEEMQRDHLTRHQHHSRHRQQWYCHHRIVLVNCAASNILQVISQVLAEAAKKSEF